MYDNVNISPMLQNLMQHQPQGAALTSGTLVTFQYKFFKTDPYPLVIISRSANGSFIKGVNLHYLTFNYIKNILQAYAGNTSFSWSQIKLNSYLSDAFRHYKWDGVQWQTFRALDAQLIVKVANMVRSVDPGEIRAIKNTIQQQVNQQMNVTADQLSNIGQGQAPPN